MAAPSNPGNADGATQVSDGRTWAWSQAKGAWFPVDPEPYETVEGPGGEEWMYDPVLRQWIDPLDFPGALPEGPDAVVRKIAGDPQP